MKGFATRDASVKALSPECTRDTADRYRRRCRRLRKLALLSDAAIIFAALAFAVRIEWQTPWFWRVGELSKIPLWKLLVALGGFAIVLLWTSNHQYESALRKPGLFQQQKANLQDCAISALFLVSVLYLTGAEALSRAFVFFFLVFVAFGFAVRRLIYRTLSAEPTGPRNVLIVGVDPTARAVRDQMRKDPELGYIFKGFVKLSNSEPEGVDEPPEIVGTIDKLADHVCKYSVSEVFLSSSCSREMAMKLVGQVRELGIDSRMILGHLRLGVTQTNRAHFLRHDNSGEKV